jgi:hypothetical protein
MKRIAAVFGTLLVAFASGAFAAEQAAPITQPAISSAPAGVSPTDTPDWLPAAFCAGDCNVYCGSGAVERYYESSAACCLRRTCQDGSNFLHAMWSSPSCWGGGECAISEEL